jgi:hypothetical protein
MRRCRLSPYISSIHLRAATLLQGDRGPPTHGGPSYMYARTHLAMYRLTIRLCSSPEVRGCCLVCAVRFSSAAAGRLHAIAAHIFSLKMYLMFLKETPGTALQRTGFSSRGERARGSLLSSTECRRFSPSLPMNERNKCILKGPAADKNVWPGDKATGH